MPELLSGVSLDASLTVADLELSTTWYTAVPGFSVSRRHERGGRVIAVPLTRCMRRRIRTTGLLALTIALGLASRRFPMWQPVWVATYAGDVLWATMVYWWLALIAPGARTVVLAGCSLAIAWGVEFSQLLHAPWFDSLRATTPGALVLGQGFLWSDLVCYTVGVMLAVAVDRWWPGFTQQSANAFP